MCGNSPCQKPGCTWGESHRGACEAREVMRWPSEKRNGYYAKVKSIRGDAAVAALIADVNRELREANGVGNTRSDDGRYDSRAVERLGKMDS